MYDCSPCVLGPEQRLLSWKALLSQVYGISCHVGAISNILSECQASELLRLQAERVGSQTARPARRSEPRAALPGLHGAVRNPASSPS